MSDKQITRLSVNLAPTVATALRDTAKRRGLSITEAIRHAVAVWALIVEEQDKGHRVIIEDRNGDHRREVVLV